MFEKKPPDSLALLEGRVGRCDRRGKVGPEKVIDVEVGRPVRLAGWTRKVFVVDSGSTDGTIELCRDHGIETIHRDWTNPTEQKAFAMSFCKERPWVLLLDSDETVLEDHAGNLFDAA